MLMCQLSIASIVGSSVGPSKTLLTVAVAHMYSVPARLTPSRRTVWPVPSTRWLPWTRKAFACAPGAPAAPVPAAPVPAPPVAGAGLAPAPQPRRQMSARHA